MEAEPGAGTARGMVGGRHLPIAIAVGLVLAVVLIVSIFWHPVAFTVMVAVLTTTAYVESSRVLRAVDVRLGTLVLVLATLTMLVGAAAAGRSGQALGVVVLFAGAVVWQLAARERGAVVRDLGVTVLFGLWVGFLASYAVLLVDRPSGSVLVLGVVGAAVFNDIGAYGFGVAFGRHKVAPTISPNKSWEGLVGGLVVATVAGALVLPLLGDVLTPGEGAVLAAACGLAAFVGDLTESMMKRDLGVKDFGQVLPGHGGVLDRVDGILFALPVGHYVLAVLDRLG